MSKIQSTRNYGMFTRSDHNRETNIKKRKSLMKSMKAYGFLKCFPVVVRRVGTKLIVKDGQHRLAMAESLGLPVHFVEEESDFDIAVINSSPEKWKLVDYANTYAKLGHTAYQDGLEFAGKHKLPIGVAFALLAGVTTFHNIDQVFISGEFKIKDRQWANSVAAIYGPMVALSPSVRNAVFIKACMAVCRVPEFDVKRLLHGAERCREKLVSYSTREAYLDMLEQVYNFGRAKLFGLKVAATMAMRERNVAKNPQLPQAVAGRLKGNANRHKSVVAGN